MPDQNSKIDSHSKALATEALNIRPSDLTVADRSQLQNLILDHLGCCYRGAHVPWGVKMREWAHSEGSIGNAPLLGDNIRTSVANAAFVNATAAHGLELDDTHDESISHPGAAVIATALATAIAEESNADKMLAAIAAGYEVVARVGAATNAAHVVEHGFHPTSLFAGFGAAATAASLHDFSVSNLQRAWGLMLSMAGGSMQFSQERTGTTVKRLHGGLAALHGVLAINLVRLGIHGPEHAFDGRYGLLNIFGGDTKASRLSRSHRDAPEIHRISFKLYPCCRFFHSTLDALALVTDEFTIDPDSIIRFTVGGPEVLSTQHVVRRPESEMAAQYSLPFALGAAMTFGPKSVDGYVASVLGDSRILKIADRVTVISDDSLQAQYPEHFGSWLEIELADGSKCREQVIDSVGTPANPVSSEDLIDKFDSLVAPVSDSLVGADVFARIGALDSGESIARLMAKFCQ